MIAIRSVLVVLAFGLGGLSVKAADSPISAFPDDTGIIVRLKNPQKTLQRAGELAVQVDRKEGIKVQLATPLLGVAISNPTLKGVDLNGDWWLAMFPVADGDPGLVFCIPATDADALQKSVMGDYKFQTFEKWVIYTEHAESADKIKRQLSKKGDSISSLQDKTSTAIWDEGDLSVFVNVPQLLKVYRGPFDEGVKKANDVLEQLPAMVPPQGGMDMKAIFDMYAGLFNQLAQAVRDAQGWTGGLSITAKGIAIDEYANFSEGSATRKILAGYKPSSLEDLGQLPAGRLGYGAAKLDMGALIKWGMKFSLQMFAEGDTEKEKLVKELMAEYQKVEFGGMAMAFGLGDAKNGAMRISALVEVNDPQAIRKLSEKSSKLMGNYTVAGMTMKMSYKPEAETYGKLKADIARVKYEFDKNADPFQAQMQAKMNEMLYGSDGMVTRTFYLKGRMAQAFGGDKADAQALLDALNGKNAIGGNQAFQSTRGKLSPKANLIGLLDLPGTIAAGINLGVESGAPVPFNENDVKSIRGETSFLGFSLAAEGQGLRAKTVVPVEQMQGVARFVRLIQEARQQGL